ncbi:MAG TPA: hypothetical protein ENK59_05560 [Thioploca sp.]|nr:hypothetical protein [Thioploca sp.]
MLILILLFSFNTTMATELTQVSSSYEPIKLTEKFDTRRRGIGCGTPPNIWAVSICKMDAFCYTAPNEVSLWLPPAKRTEGFNFVTIKNLTTKQKITKRWQVSDITIPWPIGEVPLISGDNYSIGFSNRNGASSYSVILNAIPSELSEVVQQIEWMKEKGCTKQVEMLLEEQDT